MIYWDEFRVMMTLTVAIVKDLKKNTKTGSRTILLMRNSNCGSIFSNDFDFEYFLILNLSFYI